MPNNEFKNFIEYLQENNEDINIDNLISESFYSIDEGILSNIKNLGFFRGLKLSLGKGIVAFLDLIKENPKMQKDLTTFITKIGSSAASEFGTIVGNMTKKLQEENDLLKQRIKDAEKLKYDI